MKKLIITKIILLTVALTWMIGCSKKTDEAITPSNATLTGKWKHNGSTGKLTYTSSGQTKGFDLNDDADGSIIEFKTDGTAIFEGENVKYILTGTAVVLNYGTGKPTIDFTISKFTSSTMTISFTKDQVFKYIERYYNTNDADVRDLIKNKANAVLTEYNENYLK